MKAGIHLVLFIATVYDYFFPKKQVSELEADAPNLADIESTNKDELIPYGNDEAFKRSRSYSDVQPRRTVAVGGSMFDFDDDQEEEEDRAEQEAHYTSLANDELEKWQRDKQQDGLIGSVKTRASKIWDGAGQIMTKYAKRRSDLNKATIQNSETLTGVSQYIKTKSENAQTKINDFMYSGKVTNEMRSEFNEDFVTI